jgi:hypothetical protein
MYHKGYGPTNVTLGNYLKESFLNQKSEAVDGSTTVEHRADTIAAEELAKAQKPKPPA